MNQYRWEQSHRSASQRFISRLLHTKNVDKKTNATFVAPTAFGNEESKADYQSASSLNLSKDQKDSYWTSKLEPVTVHKKVLIFHYTQYADQTRTLL